MLHLINKLLDLLDRIQRRHSWLGFPFAVQKKFSEDQSGSLAGLIAYYGFFSMFPLLLVFTAILGLVLHGNPSAQAEILKAAKGEFPSLSEYVHVGTPTSNGLALGVGVITALWAGFAVTTAAQNAMNNVWGVSVVRRPDFLRARLRGLGLLALLGATIIGSTALSALSGAHGPHSNLLNLLALVAGLVLNIVLYLVAFQLLTGIHVPWEDLLPGALLGAVLWTALQYLGGYYTRHVVAHASHLYGSFAIVIGMLTWIYLGAQMTIYCAQINVVLASRMWPRSLHGDDLTKADVVAHQWQVDKVDRRRQALESK